LCRWLSRRLSYKKLIIICNRLTFNRIVYENQNDMHPRVTSAEKWADERVGLTAVSTDVT
jgi:hypothetical protein